MRCVLTASLFLLATSLPAPGQDSLVVRGTVRDRADGRPLIGITVHAGGDRSGGTNAFGTYFIRVPRDAVVQGRITVAATAMNHFAASRGVLVRGDTLVVDFYLWQIPGGRPHVMPHGQALAYGRCEFGLCAAPRVYLAVLDSLPLHPENHVYRPFHAPPVDAPSIHGGPVRIADELFVDPWFVPNRSYPAVASLPLPRGTSPGSAEGGNTRQIVELGSVVRNDGSLTLGPPLVVFSPIDWLAENAARVYAAIYWEDLEHAVLYRAQVEASDEGIGTSLRRIWTLRYAAHERRRGGLPASGERRAALDSITRDGLIVRGHSITDPESGNPIIVVDSENPTPDSLLGPEGTCGVRGTAWTNPARTGIAVAPPPVGLEACAGEGGRLVIPPGETVTHPDRDTICQRRSKIAQMRRVKIAHSAS